MAAALRCPDCGVSYTRADRFCGACGLDLTDRMPPEPVKPRVASGLDKTLVGVMAPMVAAAQEPARGRTKAMSEAPVEGGAARLQKTMLGVSAPRVAASGSVAKVPVGQPPGRLLTPERDPSRPAATSFGAGDGDQTSKVLGKTMVGLSPAALGAPHEVAAPPRRPAANTPAFAVPAAFSAFSTTPQRDIATIVTSARRPAPSRPGRWVAALVVGLIAAGVIGLGARWLARPELSVRMVRLGQKDAIEVHIAGRAAGTRVRIADVDQPLVAGRALFELSADSLRAGDHELTVGLTEPDGSTEELETPLHVEYRVRTDLSRLAAEPPAIDVVVDAVPGARVSIEGQPAAADARGFVRRIGIPPQAGDAYRFAARYEVARAGRTLRGEVVLDLPTTRLALDKANLALVTDQALFQLEGRVEPGASVSVDGTPVAVEGERFRHGAAMPKVGEYAFSVVARAASKAPRLMTLQVRRVDNLALSATAFQADPTLTYAQLAMAPANYVGRKVAFDGLLERIEAREGGWSDLGLRVRSCAEPAGCLVSVEYPHALDLAAGTPIRVLGSVAGANGSGASQLRVRATYVLKLVEEPGVAPR